MINKDNYSVAYLSMEIALENEIKTYAGGLGILAGDILKSAAQKKFPMIGITLINRLGYFKQKINNSGRQIETIDRDYNFALLKKLDAEISVNIGKDQVRVGVWQYIIKGKNDFEIPVYFLDTNILGNKGVYKKITSKLYGGSPEMRLRQEIVLGRGGVKIIEVLGYKNIKKYHLNEGHGALTAIELFYKAKALSDGGKIKEVKNKCIFTTHTPIKTVYDDFSRSLLLKNQMDFPINLPNLIVEEKINMLDLAMYFSGYVNGVSKRHGEVLKEMFPKRDIKYITNGVNSVYWSSDEFKKIYDKYIKGWRENGKLLKKVNSVSKEEIWLAHQINKNILLKYLKTKFKINWQDNVFTIAYARRFTEYKQPLFLFANPEKLLSVLGEGGGAQIIISGKAHHRDMTGQEAIKKIYQIKKKYPKLNIVFLENYNLDMAHLLTAGVDLWVNTPMPPLEASGTSGMKAAHNGVPQLSTPDGWWLEGYKKNKTGWTINTPDELYEILKKEIMPSYYQKSPDWQEILKNVISINASYFNSDRVLDQYISEAYK